MSDTSHESKAAVNDKSSANCDTTDEESKKAMDRINNESSDSVTPPPPKLTPIRRRGRPPGSLNKPKHLALPHLHSMKQRGRGAVGRPRGIGRGQSVKRGFGRGMSQGRGTSKAVSLLKTIGRGLNRSPGKVVRGRGGAGDRGRGIRGSAMNKMRMKPGRSPGRPKKLDKTAQSNDKNTPKSMNSPKDIKSMKFFSHLKVDKSSAENDRKWENMGSLEGVSILEHEPDTLGDEYDFDEEDFYNGDSDSLMERPVDVRNYWMPPNNIKSLLDQVCITDVTTNSGTITFRECTSESGFFSAENGSHS